TLPAMCLLFVDAHCTLTKTPCQHGLLRTVTFISGFLAFQGFTYLASQHTIWRQASVFESVRFRGVMQPPSARGRQFPMAQNRIYNFLYGVNHQRWILKLNVMATCLGYYLFAVV